MYSAIITHKGAAHRDDFISCCIALAAYPDIKLIERRDPTPEELEDPYTLVLDVGGQHDPRKGNFDHHQLPAEAPACCALTLLLQHLGREQQFRLMEWFKTTEIMDAKGPAALAAYLEIPVKALYRNMSPIEGAMIDIFEQHASLLEHDINGAPMPFWTTMRALGDHLLLHARIFAEQMAFLHKEARFIYIGPPGTTVEVMIVPSSRTLGVQKFKDEVNPKIAVSISHDDRGDGWCLYRFDDHPSVDFSRLKDDPRILFTASTGFIAKTKTRLPLEEVIELVKLALR